MQIAALPQRYKICAFVLALAVLAWLYAGVVLFPAQQRIAELENQLRMERGWVKVVQDFGMANPEPAKYLKLLDDKLGSFDRLLPPDSRVSEFLSQSEAAAAASGVQLVSLKPGPAVNKSGYRDWTMELVVRGSFFQTMNFIKKLEAGPRFNTVNSLSMQTKPGHLESKLSVSIFSFGASANAPKQAPAK